MAFNKSNGKFSKINWRNVNVKVIKYSLMFEKADHLRDKEDYITVFVCENQEKINRGF